MPKKQSTAHKKESTGSKRKVQSAARKQSHNANAAQEQSDGQHPKGTKRCWTTSNCWEDDQGADQPAQRRKQSNASRTSKCSEDDQGAEQPAVKERSHSTNSDVVEEPKESDLDVKLTKNIAFITCGSDWVLDNRKERRKLKRVLDDMLGLGCTMFAFAFAHQVNVTTVAGSLERHMRKAYDVEMGGIQQTTNSICMWLHNFGEHVASQNIVHEADLSMPWVPMVAHLFDTDAGNVLVIPTVWPPMEPWSIDDLLWKNLRFIDRLDRDVQWVFIGGALQCDMCIAENVVAKFKSPMHFVVTGKQTVFVYAGDDEGLVSSSIHTKEKGPWSCFCKIPTLEKEERARAVQPQKAPSKTPKWDAVLNNMKGHAPEFLDYVANQCFYGKLLFKTFLGHDMDEPFSVSLKMEMLLNACTGRRDKYVALLRQQENLRCNWWEPEKDYSIIFNDKDMQYIMNAWRKDPKSYMQAKTLEEYYYQLEWDDDRAHRIQKSCFSNHLHQISGNRFLVHCFIRFPVTERCAEQPIISSLCDAYEVHKNSEEYMKAVRQSEQRRENQLKVSEALWWAEDKLHKGRHLSFQVRAGKVTFLDLPQWKQDLAENYENGKLGEEVTKLHKEREAEQTAPKYAGAGASICARLSEPVDVQLC